MSRRSAASLAVVQSARDFAPSPSELSDEEAKLWRGIIATKPVEWFGPDTFPLLAGYCRIAVEQRTVSEALQGITASDLATDSSALERYQSLHKIADAQRRTLALFATKMRLAQQSRYDEKRAHTAAGKVSPAGVKPWD